jgi:putative PIN family toxin of toxin-antitoxin system
VRTAVLDTNVILQFHLSSSRSASVRTLEAFYASRFRLLYSAAVLDEYFDVLTTPTIRRRHQLADDEILEFLASLLLPGCRYPGLLSVDADVVRDVTDVKFLTLAAESKANYLVTNDRRHLLTVRRYGHTRIVTPTQFLRELP